MRTQALPQYITVLERGWLSSNSVLLHGREHMALVDTGYGTQSGQTVELVRHALAGRPLDLIVNTHLHSDHCGGNAALQAEHPEAQTLIPPGQADAVSRWDTEALTYDTTGQVCERFRFDAVLKVGTSLRLGDTNWDIHAAPGHDPDSIVLFEPSEGVLISADALWENGFGIVFPELEGVSAFSDVAATLDLIAELRPRWVIPGHGRVFGSGDGAVDQALARARSRLAGFAADPARHARHAAKVLLKFKLLDAQALSCAELLEWALHTPYLRLMAARYFPGQAAEQWLASVLQDLIKIGAAEMRGDRLCNT